ncbi:MAG: DUF3540 domain-containing protein [Planctomycetota bacterium]|nr:DUF3540 domain-containing protein [Planctomycetota bacterium]
MQHPSAAVWPPVANPSAADDGYLGPAEVVEVATGRLRVRLLEADGAPVVDAALALAAPFAPSAGDRLLVLARGQEAWAIGALGAPVRARLDLPGDVDVRAVGGTLTLRGDRGVEVEGDEIALRARLLRTFAGTLTERVDTAFRWVKDQLRVQAGESRRVVQGEDLSHCERSVTLARETLKLDGHQVQIGH